MTKAEGGQPSCPPSGFAKLAIQLRLCRRFYTRLDAPIHHGTIDGIRIRAAAAYKPEFVHALIDLYHSKSAAGQVKTVNFRSKIVTPNGSTKRYFVKEFVKYHALHDLERAIRYTRADRVWRAAYLLPTLGFLTPPPVGLAVISDSTGEATDYVVTEMVEGGIPYHERVMPLSGHARRAMLHEFVIYLRQLHDSSIYLRDLLTNVLTRESGGNLEYWLTDLDQFHPYRRITRKRLLHHMFQLARWTGPLSEDETNDIVATYAGTKKGSLPRAIKRVLTTTAPADMN